MDIQEFEELESRAQAGQVQAMRRLGNLYKKGKVFGGLAIPKNTERANQLFQAVSAKRRATIRRIFTPSKFRENLSALGTLIDNGITRIETFVASVFKALGVLLVAVVLIALAAAILWLVARGVSGLPVSVAIIIGAIIIASSMRR